MTNVAFLKSCCALLGPTSFWRLLLYRHRSSIWSENDSAFYSWKGENVASSYTVIRWPSSPDAVLWWKIYMCRLCCWHTDLLAVASSYPEPADAKLTPLLSCPGFNFGSRKPGMLLAIPSFSAAQPESCAVSILLNSSEHHKSCKQKHQSNHFSCAQFPPSFVHFEINTFEQPKRRHRSFLVYDLVGN